MDTSPDDDDIADRQDLAAELLAFSQFVANEHVNGSDLLDYLRRMHAGSLEPHWVLWRLAANARDHYARFGTEADVYCCDNLSSQLRQMATGVLTGRLQP